jgi:hypothetical protein
MSRETKFGSRENFYSLGIAPPRRVSFQATTPRQRPQLFAPRAMTGTTREAKSDMVRARVADEATKVAVPVIVRARPVASNEPPLSGRPNRFFFCAKVSRSSRHLPFAG